MYSYSTLDGNLVHHLVTPQTWLEKDTVRIQYLTQEHNTARAPRLELKPRPWLDLKPGTLHLESSVLTMRQTTLVQLPGVKHFA